MSKLEQLIQELCPNGVEYKTIDTICEIQNGYTPSKNNEKYWEGGDVPWFRMEDIRTNGKILADAMQHVHHSGVKGNGFPADSIIFATTATIGKHALIKVPFLCNQQLTHIHIKNQYKKSIDIKYLFYYSDVIDEMCKNNIKGGSTLQAVNMTAFKKFQIPIPPLEIQREIVRILDNFTELTAELTAELIARKQQYEYYRDSLLTSRDDVEWQKIGNIGELVRGNGLPKSDFTEFGIPAIHYGQIYTYYGTSTNETKSFVSLETSEKLKKVDCGDVVVTNTSENLKDVGKAVLYLGKKQAVTGGHATIFKPSNQLLGKYFVYFTQTVLFSKQKRKYAKGTKVIDVSAADLSKFEIPLPHISEQQRIVDILDRFDTMCNDISQGLPAEIEARNKQYEYYRDKLLDLPKLEQDA